MDCGGLCVMTPGLQKTLVWLVVNLDFLLPIPVGPEVVLEGEVLVFCSGQCFGQHDVPYLNQEQLYTYIYIYIYLVKIAV